MSFWDSRRRRFRDIFDEIRSMFEEMERRFFEDFRFPEIDLRDLEKLPKRKLSDGTEVTGPFVWGWSVHIGPDGRPEIREFGNIPREGLREPGSLRGLSEVREPLTDIIETENEVIIVAETPGIEKDEIKIDSTETELEIKAGDKFYKKVKLPSATIPEQAKASYKNGILEIKIPKKERKGTGIKIE
ncbi:MAG: archaeal heat shock protein Hsp20 [Candidatus Jordarchaeaceae archaeon]